MDAPKLFISYCWTSPDHEDWVLRLGGELRDSGVDVILDKWDLKEGHDANAFMERMVTDDSIKKVILVIDREYSEKADSRKGGVGVETQIVSSEVYESVDQNKFVAVVAERDSKGDAKLPAFYKSRIYIDLSSGEEYGKNIEQLLRWIYDKPLHIKPELGNKPAFLDDESAVSSGTAVSGRRLLDATRNSKPFAKGALREYFDLFSNNLERFRLPPSGGAENFDEKVVESIENFIPARNELIEIFSVTAQYEMGDHLENNLHKFFESLIPYTNAPREMGRYHKWDWDNLKFIVQECFLLAVAIYIHNERYDVVRKLVCERYYTELDGRKEMTSFSIFRNHLESLNHRNSRLELRRLSLTADLYKERSENSGIDFEEIMQADFVLYVADCLDALREGKKQRWRPETLLYKSTWGGAFELFLRSESKFFFDRISPIFSIETKDDLEPFVEAIGSEILNTPKWQFERIEPLDLMNYENLCSRL